MPWYEYECPSGHLTERRGGVEDSHTPCPDCSQQAKRREFNLAALVGATVMKAQKYRVSEYIEASQEVDYHYTKAENEFVIEMIAAGRIDPTPMLSHRVGLDELHLVVSDTVAASIGRRLYKRLTELMGEETARQLFASRLRVLSL